MLAEYGLDLWQELTGPRLRWGRLRVLIEGLPATAAYNRALQGDKADWAISEQLLAHVAHLLSLSLYQNADPKKRGPAPAPISTPWNAKSGRISAAISDRLKSLAKRNAERKGL